MFRLNRNERSRWSGNGVHVEPESVFMIGRNMQECRPRDRPTDNKQETGAFRRTSAESAPGSPSGPFQIDSQTISLITLRIPPCNPTRSPLHDLTGPQRKPKDSREKDGREKGGNEKGPEGQVQRHRCPPKRQIPKVSR